MSDYQTKDAAQKSAEAQQNEKNAGKELLNSFANYGKSIYEHGKANAELAGAMLHDAGTYVADKAEDAYNGAVNAAQCRKLCGRKSRKYMERYHKYCNGYRRIFL